MATAKVAQTLKFEMNPLPELDRKSLIPKLDLSGYSGAITQLWEAFSQQQQITSELAAELQQQKEDHSRDVADMKDHFYGQINGLRDDLKKSNEENRQMNDALKDLMKATERETKQAIHDVEDKVNDKISDVQQQVTHSAHVANTALERAVDAKQASDENAQRISDVEDTLATDLNRLTRTLGLTKSEIRRAVDNGTEKESMLATPALAHIISLIETNKEGAGLSEEDRDVLASLRARIDRQEHKHIDLATELRETDKNLGNRIERLESAVRSGSISSTTSTEPATNISTTAGSGAGSKEQTDALNAALTKLRADVAQLRSALDTVAREAAKKADGETVDKLADSHASLASRVAALEGTLNDTRASVDEALRLARQALRNQANMPQNSMNTSQRPTHSSGADAQAVMMLRDALDALTGRVAHLEREVNDIDAKKASHDDLNGAVQDVLKAMEQAIAQLYEELKKQLGALGSPLGAAGDEDGTSGRYRCLSCNRRAGPLQDRYHERVSKPLLPPGDTLLSNTVGGISPPRRSPPRHVAPQVPGVRDGFEPRPLTGSRRKLQTYYDWLQSKGGALPTISNDSAESNLQNGLVGKTFTSRNSNMNMNMPPPSGREPSPDHSHQQQQQQQEDQVMTSARVHLAEMPPHRSESPNPATAVGSDGKHYIGIQTRTIASQFAPKPVGGGVNSSTAALQPNRPPSGGGTNTPVQASATSAGGMTSARPGTASSARR